MALVLVYGALFKTAPYDLLSSANLLRSSTERRTARLEALDDIDRGQADRRATLLCLGVGALLTFALPIQRRVEARNLAGWSGLAFVGIAVLSTSWSHDPDVTLRRSGALIILCLLSLAAARLWHLEEIMIGILLGMLATLLLGVAASVSIGQFHPLLPDWRFAGVAHPNTMAVNCGILMFTALALANKKAPGCAILMLSIASIGLLGLVLTKSRGGIVAAVGAAAAFGLLRMRSRPAIAAITMLGVCLAVVALVTDDLSGTFLWVARMGRADGGDLASLTGRTALWAQLLGYVKEAPVLGYGYASFWVPNRILEVARVQGWIVGSAHSGYLDVLLGLGLVGGVLWLTTLAGTVSALYKEHASQRQAVQAGAIAILLLVCIDMGVEDLSLDMSFPSLAFMSLIARTLYVIVPTEGNPQRANAVAHSPGVSSRLVWRRGSAA